MKIENQNSVTVYEDLRNRKAALSFISQDINPIGMQRGTVPLNEGKDAPKLHNKRCRLED